MIYVEKINQRLLIIFFFYCEPIFSFTLTGSPAANLELFRRLSRTKHHTKFLQPSCLRFPCGHNYNLLFGPSTLFPALFEEFQPALVFLGKTDLSQALEQERDVCLRDLKNKTGFLLKKQMGKFNVNEWSLPFHSKHFLPIPLLWMKGEKHIQIDRYVK